MENYFYNNAHLFIQQKCSEHILCAPQWIYRVNKLEMVTAVLEPGGLVWGDKHEIIINI